MLCQEDCCAGGRHGSLLWVRLPHISGTRTTLFAAFHKSAALTQHLLLRHVHLEHLQSTCCYVLMHFWPLLHTLFSSHYSTQQRSFLRLMRSVAFTLHPVPRLSHMTCSNATVVSHDRPQRL